MKNPDAATLAGYGFVATQYESQGGHGGARIRQSSRGWVVEHWSSAGYQDIAEPQPTLDQALAAYHQWVHRPADNDQEF